MRARVLLLAILVVPASAAQFAAPQGDPARLWMHFDLPASDSSTWSDGVMNVQPVPSVTYQDAHPSLGKPAWPIYVSPDLLPLEEQGTNYNHHHWLPVQYDYTLVAPIRLHWVFFAQTVPQAGIAPTPELGIPLVAQLEARLEVVYGGGFDTPVLEELARGRSATFVLAGEASKGVQVVQVDGRLAYAVDVVLEPHEISFVVPGAGHFLRLGVDLVLPVESSIDAALVEEPRDAPAWDGWAVSAPGNPSYLDVAATESLRVEDLQAWSIAGAVGVRARLLSPWGLPDLQPAEGTSILHLDASPGEVTYDPPVHEDFHAKFSGYHTWSFRPDPPLEPGNHTVRLALTSFDGSSHLEASYQVPVLASGDPVTCSGATLAAGRPHAFFCSEPDVEQATPAPTLALLAALLALAVAARRRHWAGSVRT